MSVTIPQTRSMRLWYGHWGPSLKYQKKTRSDRPWYGYWRLKKPGLWDHGMAFDVRVQNVLKKNPVWQTVVWPLGLKRPGLTDRGVATGVTKFRIASGGLMKFTWLVRVHPWVNPIAFGNNWPNRTTDIGENVSLKPVFCFHSAGTAFFEEKTRK